MELIRVLLFNTIITKIDLQTDKFDNTVKEERFKDAEFSEFCASLTKEFKEKFCNLKFFH